MVFRLIGIVLELLWAIARREVEIDSLKKRADKSEEQLKTRSEKVRELQSRITALESRREFDVERIKALEARRDFHSEQIARLERWRDFNTDNPKPRINEVPLKSEPTPESEDRPEKTLSELLQEVTDDAIRQRQAVVAAAKTATEANPTDN